MPPERFITPWYLRISAKSGKCLHSACFCCGICSLEKVLEKNSFILFAESGQNHLSRKTRLLWIAMTFFGWQHWKSSDTKILACNIGRISICTEQYRSCIPVILSYLDEYNNNFFVDLIYKWAHGAYISMNQPTLDDHAYWGSEFYGFHHTCSLS